MLKKFFFSAAITAAALLTPAVNAEIIEITKKAELNPGIYFSGVPGNPGLTAEIRNFLGVCGWFDLATDPARADYTVSAENNGSNLVIRLLQGKTGVAAWRFNNSSNHRELAKSVTDTIIEQAFKQLKVKGFCRSKIAFCAETAPRIRNIFTCDIDGNNVKQITNYRTLNVEPGWNHDGTSIFFSKYNLSGIDIVETTVNPPRRSRIISSSRGINTGAAVSPDGTRLAAILSFDRQVDLYCLSLNRKQRTRLTRGIAVEASPCWSPDGSRIAFVSDRNGAPRIFIISAAGGRLQMLPTIGRDAVTPAWSQDDKIAYAAKVNGRYTIAVYDLKTGKNRRVINLPGDWESPGWAADNRQLVCRRSSGRNSELYVIDTKTGKQRLLLRTGSRLFEPSWSPCRAR